MGLSVSTFFNFYYIIIIALFATLCASSPAPLHSVTPLHTVTDRIFASVFASMVEEVLNRYSYYATLANLSFFLSNDGDSFSLGVYGFNQKAPVLLQKMVETMKNMEVDPATFDRVLQEAIRSKRNTKTKAPYQQLLLSLGFLINHDKYDWTQLRDAAEKFDLETFNVLRETLISSFAIQSFGIGNLSAEDTISMTSVVFDTLGFVPIPSSLVNTSRASMLKDGTDYILQCEGLNPEDTNSCAGVVFQFAPESPRSSALLGLLSELLSQPFYDDLRTKQQLGYLCWSFEKQDSGIDYLMFLLQSDKVNGGEVHDRIETFIEEWRDALIGTEDKTFASTREAYKITLLDKPKNLNSYFDRMW